MSNIEENSTITAKNSKAKVKAKAHATAGWEWFKSAAWLQVLLIVGVVVGIVISIPYIVTGIRNAVADGGITFYKDHEISYDQLQRFINGEDQSAKGYVGATDNKWSTTEDGFAVMFYKDNCSDCTSMQENLDRWYSKVSISSNANAKFYTVNVAFVPGSSSESSDAESSPSNYKNTSISLSQQYDVMQSVRDIYLSQNDLHRNSSVGEDMFEYAYDADNAPQSTLPTPLFILYTKDSNSQTYTPSRVMFGVLNGYSNTSKSDISVSMYDLYNFAIASEKSSSTNSSSSSN